MRTSGPLLWTTLIVCGIEVARAQDDADPDLQSQIDSSLFNAAYRKPVIADSYLGDGLGTLNADELCDPVHPNNGCEPSNVVDGFAGNSHRWISSDVSPYHWLVIDLERQEWVQSVSIFAGRDAPGDGQYHPVSGLCSYVIWAWSGDSHADLSREMAESDDGWIELDQQLAETTEEAHDNFAPVLTKFIRITIDQSTCQSGPEYGCYDPICNNYAKVYEVQVFAEYPDSACANELVISGAGSAIVNGEYFADGTSTGITRYTKPASPAAAGAVNPAITLVRRS